MGRWLPCLRLEGLSCKTNPRTLAQATDHALESTVCGPQVWAGSQSSKSSRVYRWYLTCLGKTDPFPGVSSATSEMGKLGVFICEIAGEVRLIVAVAVIFQHAWILLGEGRFPASDLRRVADVKLGKALSVVCLHLFAFKKI